eukprot:scaffold125122_cov63-Phaeocystis_antarctica.AAC.1
MPAAAPSWWWAAAPRRQLAARVSGAGVARLARGTAATGRASGRTGSSAAGASRLRPWPPTLRARAATALAAAGS